VLRMSSVALLALALAAGTAADRPRIHPPLIIDGYRVLAADLHTHSGTWSDGALTVWGLVLEASRQDLDVIAITGHDQLFEGRIGRWFARAASGPLVLAGEEILSDPYGYHLVALGIHESIGFDQPAASAIDAVHQQGGVAIAVHPMRSAWTAFDANAMARLDAAEICHPLIYAIDDGQQQLEAFAARGRPAAIGSSDFHGTGRMGLCRTFVFVREASEEGVLDALRAHRTVVFGLGGRAYGDPDLLRLAANDPRIGENARAPWRMSTLDWISRVAGVLGLAAIAVVQCAAAVVRDRL